MWAPIRATCSWIVPRGRGCPTILPRTYIRLRQDRAVPWELQERMLSLLPGLSTRVMDTGHNIMVSHPRELAAVLEDIAAQV